MSDRESSADDLSLPKATVQKIVSEILPPDLVFSRETRDVLIDCCIEFIGLLSTQANDMAEADAKKTIASDHVIRALVELGFPEYVGPINEVVQEHKETQKGRERKVGKFEASGLTEEELLRKQEELFGLARSKLQSDGSDYKQT
ncbi:histone-fold-containing protein [Lipomyces oligophaga]|uniref:histone-fold-containing protein n=1 Tax=Lipomyces oligophaga TaxID=45792 RepID=UPI0034CE9AC1